MSDNSRAASRSRGLLSNMGTYKISTASRLARSLTNPFAAYAAGFTLAIAVYSLGYSDLYPPLLLSLKWFLLATCAVSALLAYASSNSAHLTDAIGEHVGTQLAIFLAIMSVFALEVIVNRGIPLLLIAADADFSYRDFGIPAIHVAFVGSCYFFAVFWFDLYMLGNGRLFLGFSATALGTSLLIVNRGAFILTLMAIIIVYIRRRGLNRRLLLSFGLLAGVVLWGFGVLGDLRTHGLSGESIILSVGDASDKFLNSKIPTEFFWPYLYTSSPLANLQLNITDRLSTDTPSLYFMLEYLPDFVSKRLVPEASIVAASPLLVTDQLTVCTMYGRAFLLMGWLGLILGFAYFVAVSLVCLSLLKRSKYFVATAGVLSAIAFLGIFDNMYINSGGILLVLTALLLSRFERKPVAEDLLI